MNAQPRPLVIAGVLIICVIIIGLLLAYLPLPEGIRSMLNIAFAPQEVRNHAYLGVENGKGVVYELGVMGIEKRSFENFSIVEYARAGDIDVAILKDAEGSYDVYSVSRDTLEQLTNDGRMKGSLDISPDGTQVVYGVQARTLPPPKGTPEDGLVYNLQEWDVEHISLETKTVSLVGLGNHPRFYKEGLFYPTPIGLMYRVIDADGFDKQDTWSVFPDEMAYRMLDIPVLTTEGLLLFPSVSRSSFEALVLTSVSPLHLTTAPNHPIDVPQGTRDISLIGTNKINTITYGADGKARVLRIADGQPVSLFAFPSGLYPEQFINEK